MVVERLLFLISDFRWLVEEMRRDSVSLSFSVPLQAVPYPNSIQLYIKQIKVYFCTHCYCYHVFHGILLCMVFCNLRILKEVRLGNTYLLTSEGKSFSLCLHFPYMSWGSNQKADKPVHFLKWSDFMSMKLALNAHCFVQYGHCCIY